MEPISPKEAKANRLRTINPAVIQAVNELLSEKLVNHSLSITKKEVIARAKKIDSTITEKYLYDKNQLDFEDAYRNNGWQVAFHSPDRGDSHFDDYYTFNIK